MKKGFSKNRHFSKGCKKRNSNTPLVINMTINIIYKDGYDEGERIAKETLWWTKMVGTAQLIESAINWLVQLGHF